jgi:hypothetical protein
MAVLSISRAWEETKRVVAHDGRLIASIALALVALPTAVSSLIDPNGVAGPSSPPSMIALMTVASLLALAGQLALIRLALGPSITVGAAIAHGLKRMPIYLLSAILIVAALMLLAIPFGLAFAALGVPLESGERTRLPMTPGVTLAIILFLALVLFFGVRMLMTAPVASAENAGPLAIIRRSWTLTAGNWWRLLGFLLVFFLGAVVVLVAVNAATGAIAAVALGPIEPMSASALLVALVGAVANAAITGLFAVMLARIYVQLAGTSDAQASVPSSGT